MSAPGRAGAGSSGTRAIALLGAFTAWSFLSIAWAGVKGDAWDGANRTLLYLTVYAAFALLSWRARDAAVVIGVFAFGTAAIGAAEFARDGTSAFIDGRLAAPTGYANASAALFLAAFWPAVSLAARTEVHWLMRGLLLAAGGVLLQLAILAQSRGSMVAGTIALLVYFLVSRSRLRAFLVLLPVAAVALVSLAPLLDVFASTTQAELQDAVVREQKALAISTGALLLVGALAGFVDRPGRITASARALAGRRRAVLAMAVAGGALVALGAVVAISSFVAQAGREEVQSGATSALASSRFGGGLETGRYDMWRVAAGEVVDHPFLGVGADNFATDFVRERQTHEEPLYPHSLLLRSFSQTGLMGGGLFLAFVGVALVAPLRRRPKSDSLANAVVSASVVYATYWVVHGSIDWFWEIPGLAAPALAFLGLALGLRDATPRRPLPGARRSVGIVAFTAVLCAAATGSYVLPGLAAFEVERGVKAWPEAPDRAFSELSRARRLNPLSEQPDVMAGTLAVRAHRPGQAQAAFERALERAPNDWYVHLRLALLAAAGGRQEQALGLLRRAQALNPLEPTLEDAEEALLAGAIPSQSLLWRVEQLAARSPLGRKPVDCGPVLGLASRCT
jgi:hypothetical protein